jgi:hypothetical protein
MRNAEKDEHNDPDQVAASSDVRSRVADAFGARLVSFECYTALAQRHDLGAQRLQLGAQTQNMADASGVDALIGEHGYLRDLRHVVVRVAPGIAVRAGWRDIMGARDNPV